MITVALKNKRRVDETKEVSIISPVLIRMLGSDVSPYMSTARAAKPLLARYAACSLSNVFIPA